MEFILISQEKRELFRPQGLIKVNFMVKEEGDRQRMIDVRWLKDALSLSMSQFELFSKRSICVNS